MRARKSITFRLDPDVYALVTAYAEQTRRSANAAVNALLDSALRTAAKRGEFVPPPPVGTE